MKKMYKKGGIKKKKKYANGGPTPAGISNFYGKVDSFLDAALPGRQARQDKRADRKAIRLENRDARKDARNAVRQENAMSRIESRRMSKGGALKPVPSDNKGLSKLPTAVRNKMGFMKTGGAALETGMMKYGGSCGKVYKKGSFRRKK